MIFARSATFSWAHRGELREGIRRHVTRGAIIHEWLEPFGGAENVVDRLAGLYPSANIHALWNGAPGRYEQGRVHETWLARTPLRHHKVLALPAMLSVWRTLGQSDIDWMVCSSHLFAHHARFSGKARDADKYVYAYTPARYVWEPNLDPRGKSPVTRLASKVLQPLDRARAQEAKAVAGISNFVRERIRRAWDVDATVIYPPVDVGRFASAPENLSGEDLAVLESLPSEFILGASRFVAYKRLDLVVEAGAALGIPVVLAGAGPQESQLRAMASSRAVDVRFVHQPSHELLSMLYRAAEAFVFPAIEDFGIMPVEAMASSTPVIARTVGGASETVVDGVSGALVDHFSPGSIRQAFDTVVTLNRSDISQRAQHFDQHVFDIQVSAWLP
ncbi:glycosyltransferase [Demequina sp. SO4-13]|uniref:glycosyltransferase n=1 Tax=Demequina sp. SO4-13 TaxID=3401027 RepID=UPI003AF9D276